MKLNNGDLFCKCDDEQGWIILEVNDYIVTYGYKLDDISLIPHISYMPSSFDFNKDLYVLHNLCGPAFIKFQNENNYYIDGVYYEYKDYIIKMRIQKLKRIVEE